MDIKIRQVTTRIVDQVNLTSEEWDSRPTGSLGKWDTWGWRQHMAKLLNQRAVKFAFKLEPVDFYLNVTRFAKEIGFGEPAVITQVTERIYGVTLHFRSAQEAA